MQGMNQPASWIDRLLPKSSHHRLLIAVVGGTLITGIVTLQTVARLRPSSAESATSSPSITLQSVTALGRLEPQGEVIQLAPTTEAGRIMQILVQQGDRVKIGQVIAILDSRDRLQAALAQANRQVQIAQTQLAQVKAGAKLGEIKAQKAAVDRTAAQLREDVQAKQASVARLEAEVQNAQTEYQRYASLFQSGAVSASERDSKQLVWEASLQQLNEAKANREQASATLAAQLNQAKATLDQIAEVRPVDVAAAQAEVESAKAAVQQAEAELDLAYVRSPRAGQILKIHTWAGETVGEDGIAELGQTDQMNVVAEVYETDVQHIRTGQSAQITSAAFPGTLTGTVQDIGLQVFKKGIRDTNPTADADARIVEVKIRLAPESSRKVASLTNLEVTVDLPLSGGPKP